IAELVQVAPPQAPRVGKQFGELLQAAEEGRFLERELQLERVEHVEDDHFMSMVTKMPQGRQQVCRLVEQVAEDDDDRAAGDALGQLVKDGAERGLLRRRSLVENLHDLFQVRRLA